MPTAKVNKTLIALVAAKHVVKSSNNVSCKAERASGYELTHLHSLYRESSTRLIPLDTASRPMLLLPSLASSDASLAARRVTVLYLSYLIHLTRLFPPVCSRF